MTGVLSAVGRLALAAACGGVLAAALGLPAVGFTGLAVRDGADALRRAPLELRETPPAERVRLLDRYGRPFAQLYLRNRESVPLHRVARVMRQATVAVEDARFYRHAGLDVKGTLRALAVNLTSGGIRQGGSSLTQQLVKNMLLEQAESEAEQDRARAPTLRRKIAELRHALALERKYTKDQILERYLNIAYFGAGVFGVQAAAQRFFGVDAAELTLPQAATLAGALRTPYATDPTVGAAQRRRLLERRNLVLRRMSELGMISAAEAHRARRLPLGLRLTPAPGGCAASAHPYFCRYVHAELLANPVFGHTPDERRRRLAQGGLVLRTSLDPVAQRAAERAIAARVHPQDTEVAAEAMVEPGTGLIRALAASKRYGPGPADGPSTTYNLPADTAHGGGLGLQAGSTFKVFTLATALAKGWRFDQGFQTPGSFTPASGFTDCSGRRVNDPRATVYNADGGGKGGPFSLSTGTWKSVNVFYMMLERAVGLCDVVTTARALGVARADGRPLAEVPTFTLGVNEVDPVTVAAAFAAFAARGRYCRPLAVTEIVDRAGRRVPVPPGCRQALEPAVADAVNHVLSGVFTKGTMQGQGIGRPAAGKTGTNNGYTSAWFAGYTPHLAAAVSVGDIRGAYRHPLRGVVIGGRYYGRVYGSSLPGPIWADSMRAALRDRPAAGFHRPDMRRFGGGHTPGLREGEEEDAPDRERRARRRR